MERTKKINSTAGSPIHISKPAIDFNDKAVFNYRCLIWCVDNGHTMVKQSKKLPGWIPDNDFPTDMSFSQMCPYKCLCHPFKKQHWGDIVCHQWAMVG